MKNYVEIMAKALHQKLEKDEKPDLSIKDWHFIFHCLMALVSIINSYKKNLDYPEYLQADIEDDLEILGRITEHEIL